MEKKHYFTNGITQYATIQPIVEFWEAQSLCLLLQRKRILTNPPQTHKTTQLKRYLDTSSLSRNVLDNITIVESPIRSTPKLTCLYPDLDVVLCGDSGICRDEPLISKDESNTGMLQETKRYTLQS